MLIPSLSHEMRVRYRVGARMVPGNGGFTGEESPAHQRAGRLDCYALGLKAPPGQGIRPSEGLLTGESAVRGGNLTPPVYHTGRPGGAKTREVWTGSKLC